jgi:hypothetical protein
MPGVSGPTLYEQPVLNNHLGFALQLAQLA